MDLMSANKFDVNSAVFNISIACVTLYLVNYLFHVIKRLCKLPPGPWGLPIVGYLPFIEQDTYLQFAKLSRKYGPLFSFKYGQFDVICIDDWESTRETLASEELLARPDQVFIPGVFEDPSLFEMSGDPWKDHRRLALTILRNVGLGRKKMENQIKDEIKTFVSEIRSYNGKPFNVVNLLSLSVSNNISILLFGHRFEYTDPIGVKIEKALDELNKTGHFFNAATAIPWLVKFLLLFNHLKLEKMRQIINTIEGHVSIEVCQHQQAQKEKCEVHDYIDGYLQEMDSRQAQGKSSFTLNTLRRNTSIFYTAGADTVQLVLQWCLLYLVAYPDYQDKLRDEIFNKIGSNELPDSVDRQQMPFAMAFIYEVLRVSSVVPVGPFRRATKDINLLNGTLIPKDSLVTFNFWSIHHDPKLWTNPDSFYPERFLSEDGSKAVKPPYLIAFSGGKRVCPGESFAILQLFLYLVSIVQKFKITAELDEKISLDSFYVFTRRPKSSINLVFSETH